LATQPALSGAAHPLDPLTAAEIRQAAAIVRRERPAGPRWRFASIELAEPHKDLLRAGLPTADLPREAIAVGWNTGGGPACRALVSLTSDRLLSWTELPGQQPAITLDEWHECDELLRGHPGLVAALARRGHPDLSLVLTDVWAYGAALVPPRYRDLRLGWSDVWVRSGPGANPYAHHVSGLHPVVDLNAMTVLEIEDSLDRPGAVDPGLPAVAGEYLPRLLAAPPRELKPLHISQPDGPSFTLDGHLLRWQNWELRVGFHHREGLVLHQVGYHDDGRLRTVAHRLSFAEMVVPYRDPGPDHYRRTAFDIGEWGLGFMTTSLERGCDCLGEIRYLDAVVHDSAGQPVLIPQAICIHEEDHGIGWKHVDHHSGAQVRRSRRLVVSFQVTVANYEYLVYWRFYQDASIECAVQATGLMVTSSVTADPPPFGTLVDQGTYAPFHQHFIVARLDLDVDGRTNTVHATEAVPAGPSAADPGGLGLIRRDTPLHTESQGRQDYDWRAQRRWTVTSDEVTNSLGQPAGYQLIPGGAIPSLLDPDSPVARRTEAIGHTLWVTPYDPGERWPCGEFPTQSAGGGGLPDWTAQNRPISAADVVLWYVFGLNHLTRPEDWPVMPTDSVSFWLKPSGFFDRNPALDVPPG
jgi:primary-amine oxidase